MDSSTRFESDPCSGIEPETSPEPLFEGDTATAIEPLMLRDPRRAEYAGVDNDMEFAAWTEPEPRDRLWRLRRDMARIYLDCVVALVAMFAPVVRLAERISRTLGDAVTCCGPISIPLLTHLSTVIVLSTLAFGVQFMEMVPFLLLWERDLIVWLVVQAYHMYVVARLLTLERVWPDRYRRELTRWVESSARRPSFDPRAAKGHFSDTTVIRPRTVVNHTHGWDAAGRGAAVNFMQTMAHRTGSELFHVMMSNADVAREDQGSRLHYWAKDLTVPASYTTPDDVQPIGSQIATLVDSDFYDEDLPAHLTVRGGLLRMWLIYTYSPDSVAYARRSDDGPEAKHTFDAENRIKVNVPGGSFYTHKLWNYSTDCLRTTRGPWWYPAATVYLVESKRIMEHRRVVGLFPVATFNGWFASFLAMRLEARTLQRLQVVVPGTEVTALRVFKSDTVYISVGRIDSYMVADVCEAQFHACIVSWQNTKTTVSSAQIRSKFANLTDEAAGALLQYYYAVGPKFCRTDEVAKADLSALGVARVHFGGIEHLDTESPGLMRQYCAPFLGPAYVAVLNDATLINTLEQRGINTSLLDAAPTATSIKAINGFVKLLIPDGLANKAVPLTREEVFARQTRSTQRAQQAQMEETGVENPDERTTAFLKKEVYTEPGKDQRLIVNPSLSSKHAYAGYIMSLTDYLTVDQERLPFIAVGMTPVQVADRVARICNGAQRHANCSDYKRMDKYIRDCLRDLDRAVIRRFFAPCEIDGALEQYDKTYETRVTARLPSDGSPVYYQSHENQQSGQADTACFQTLRNAFMAFATFKAVRMSDIDAFASLGLYLGDDGITADLCPAKHAIVAGQFGQIVEPEIIHRGRFGVNFLARYYGSDVWFGNPASCCDIWRALGKLHVHAAVPVSPALVLYHKLIGYVLSDPHTPIIGELARIYCECYEVAAADDKRYMVDPYQIRSWWSRFDHSCQYPNTADVGDELLNVQLSRNEGTAGYDLLNFLAVIKQDLLHGVRPQTYARTMGHILYRRVFERDGKPVAATLEPHEHERVLCQGLTLSQELFSTQQLAPGVVLEYGGDLLIGPPPARPLGTVLAENTGKAPTLAHGNKVAGDNTARGEGRPARAERGRGRGRGGRGRGRGGDRGGRGPSRGRGAVK